MPDESASSSPDPDFANAFARETGELTAWRWKIGVTFYLFIAAAAALAEWQYYRARGPFLALAYAVQLFIVGAGWRAFRGAVTHPRSAWIVLGCNVGICLVLAIYNAAVGGDMLYVLITYVLFMSVSSVFAPWGARFQLGLNIGIVAAYSLAVAHGAHPGPLPAYDYMVIVAGTVLSTLGAYYIDQYRRQLFGQAEALRDVNRRLHAAHQARTELLTGLSHDMRTPLTVVMGHADILRDLPLTEEVRQSVRSIAREARELLYLADGVLDLARLEAGHLSLQRSVFSLAETLDPLRETTEDLLRDRDIVLRWEMSPGLSLDGDAGKVREIIRNLLSNAAKFTQQGEIRLTATPVGGGVEIAIADTGVGIAPEHLAAIFDPFHQVQQAPPSGDRRLAGVGFGLYLVKLLVTMLGGRVTVESVLHAGSTFRVWLPPQPPPAAS